MKRILTLIILVITFTAILAQAYDYESHWACEQISAFIKDGIITPDESGNVRPDENIKRSEFVKIINSKFAFQIKANVNFSDVSENAWYYNEFLLAKEAGYITGDQNGNANPEGSLTRAEASVILSRILKLNTSNFQSGFKDQIPSWAAGHIIALFNAGFIKGYTDGEFKAQNYITRAEAFSLVSRITAKKDVIPEIITASVGNTSSMPSSNRNSSSSPSGTKAPTVIDEPYIVRYVTDTNKLYIKKDPYAGSYVIKIKLPETYKEYTFTLSDLIDDDSNYCISISDKINDYSSLTNKKLTDIVLSIKAKAKNSGIKDSEFVIFKEMTLTKTYEVENVSLVPETYAFTLTFNEPNDTYYKQTMVYLNGNLAVTLDKGATFYTFSQLSPNTQYEVKLITVDTLGNISNGITHIVTTKPIDYFGEWVDGLGIGYDINVTPHEIKE